MRCYKNISIRFVYGIWCHYDKESEWSSHKKIRCYEMIITLLYNLLSINFYNLLSYMQGNTLHVW